MQKQPETLIQERIQKWFTQNKGRTVKFHGTGHTDSGEPDLFGYILIDGHYLHVKLEVKTEEGRPTPLQVHRLRQYHEAGYVVGLVTSVDDVQRLLAAHLEWLDSTLYTLPKPYICCLHSHGIDDPYNIYCKQADRSKYPCLKLPSNS